MAPKVHMRDNDDYPAMQRFNDSTGEGPAGRKSDFAPGWGDTYSKK